LAGRRNKVTARFPELADLPAGAYMRGRRREIVNAVHVRRAREARIEPAQIIETKIAK